MSNGDGKMFESETKVAQHQMDVISFASLDMSLYVSYVAKDQDATGQSLESSRACHVVQCEDAGQANRMYNAFEEAFNKNRSAPLDPYQVPDVFNPGKSLWDDTVPRRSTYQSNVDHSYYNDPNREPPISGLVNKDKHYVNQEVVEKHAKNILARERIDCNSNKTHSKPSSIASIISHVEEEKEPPIYQNPITPEAYNECPSILRKVVEDARRLPYFHKYTSRQTAEQFLKLDGDYLIRDSSLNLNDDLKNICLSVRTRSDMCQHIVLIGKSEPFIHTRDRRFETIEKLLEYNENRPLEMPQSCQSAPVLIKRAIMYEGHVEV